MIMIINDNDVDHHHKPHHHHLPLLWMSPGPLPRLPAGTDVDSGIVSPISKSVLCIIVCVIWVYTQHMCICICMYLSDLEEIDFSTMFVLPGLDVDVGEFQMHHQFVSFQGKGSDNSCGVKEGTQICASFLEYV